MVRSTSQALFNCSMMREIRASLAELAAGEVEVLTKDEILRTLTA